MIDFETKEAIRDAAFAVREFVSIHKQSLTELGVVLSIVGACAGAVFAAVISMPAPEQRCEQSATLFPSSLAMPSDEPERKWAWPIAESQETASEPTVATDAADQPEDEPAPRHHRRRHHWRRG